MLPHVKAIRTYFRKLGLEDEIADLYLALYTFGPQGISELSRNARVERTRIYRLIDTLLASNLIEVETRHKRATIKAAPIANLRILISQRRQDLRGLEDDLELVEQVLARNSLSNPSVRLQAYHGAAGIRQMLTNQLGASTEVIGYEHKPLGDIAGKTFMDRWTAEFEAKKLSLHLLYNPSSAGGPKTTDSITYQPVSPEVLNITHACRVYNDVTAYYLWKDGEIYGTETYNQAVADAQRSLIYSVTVTSRQNAT